MYRSPLFSDDGGYTAENTTSASTSLSGTQQHQQVIQRHEPHRSPSSMTSSSSPSAQRVQAEVPHAVATTTTSSPGLPAASHTVAPQRQTTNNTVNTSSSSGSQPTTGHAMTSSSDYVPTPVLLHSNIPTTITTTTTSTTNASLSSYDPHLLFGTRHDLSEIYRTTVPLAERPAVPLRTHEHHHHHNNNIAHQHRNERRAEEDEEEGGSRGFALPSPMHTRHTQLAQQQNSPQGRSPMTTPQRTRTTAAATAAGHEARTPQQHHHHTPQGHRVQEEEEEEMNWTAQHHSPGNAPTAHPYASSSPLQHQDNSNSTSHSTYTNATTATAGQNAEDALWASPSEVLQMRAMCQDLVRRYELRLTQLQRDLQRVTEERDSYAAQAGELTVLRKSYETAKKKYTTYVRHEQRWQEERALLQVQLQTLAVENQRLLLELDKQHRSAEEMAVASHAFNTTNNTKNGKGGQMTSAATTTTTTKGAETTFAAQRRNFTSVPYTNTRGISMPTTLTDTSSLPQHLGSTPPSASLESSSSPTPITTQEKTRHTNSNTPAAAIVETTTSRSTPALDGSSIVMMMGPDHTLPPRTSHSGVSNELPRSPHSHYHSNNSNGMHAGHEADSHRVTSLTANSVSGGPYSTPMTTTTTTTTNTASNTNNTSTTFTSLPSSVPAASPAALDTTAIAPADDTALPHTNIHEESETPQGAHPHNTMTPATTTTTSTSSPPQSHIQVARRRSTTAAPQSNAQPHSVTIADTATQGQGTTTTTTTSTSSSSSNTQGEAVPQVTDTAAANASPARQPRSEPNSHATTTTTNFSAPSSLASSIPLLYHMPRGPAEALREEIKLFEALHRATQTNAELEARLRTEQTAWQLSEQQQRQATLRLGAERDRLVQRLQACETEKEIALAAAKAVKEQLHVMQATLLDKQSALEAAQEALRTLQVQSAQDVQAARTSATAEAERRAKAQHDELTHALQEAEAARTAALQALQKCLDDAAARMQAQEDVLDSLRAHIAMFVRDHSATMAECEATVAAQQSTITELKQQHALMKDNNAAQTQELKSASETLATREATIKELTLAQQRLTTDLQAWQQKCAQAQQQAARITEMEALVIEWQAKAQSACGECVVHEKHLAKETRVWQNAMQVMQERHRTQLAKLSEKYATLRARWQKARAATDDGDGNVNRKKTIDKEATAAKGVQESKEADTMNMNIETGQAAALACDAVALLRASDMAVQQIAQSIMRAT